MSIVLSFLFCLTAINASYAAPAVVNGGFELPYENGWTLVTDWNLDYGANWGPWQLPYHQQPYGEDLFGKYYPVESDLFIVWRTPPDVASGLGKLTALQQDICVGEGQVLSGWAAFESWEFQSDPDNLEEPGVDSGKVIIYDQDGNEVTRPWEVIDFYLAPALYTPWMYWEWSPTVSGMYTVELAIIDSMEDGQFSSYVFFDDIKVTPEMDADNDGIGDACDPDNDNDSVDDVLDQCLETTPGDVVNADGCSIPDLCNCDNEWKNHGAYVKCVAQTTKVFVSAGLISEEEKDIIVSAAGMFECGKKSK